MAKTRAQSIPFPDANGRLVRNLGGRPGELPRPWCTLAADLGGVAKLAKRCGVSVRTIERWSQGARPGAVVQAFVRALFVRRGCLTSEPWPPIAPRPSAPVIRLHDAKRAARARTKRSRSTSRPRG
jgi:hypothetical protein